METGRVDLTKTDVYEENPPNEVIAGTLKLLRTLVKACHDHSPLKPQGQRILAALVVVYEAVYETEKSLQEDEANGLQQDRNG